MNHELLNTLMDALKLTPENHILRKEVVDGLLEAERWSDLVNAAEPLKQTEHRAMACLALAKAAFAMEDLAKARELYEEAIKENSKLIDERFEADLSPQEIAMTPMDDMRPQATTSVRPYSGPQLKFSDVGGMGSLKEHVRLNILYPFEHPELYAAYGKKIGGGILMYGPPGCGKTHLARATAGELGASFYSLELNEILSMWLGETEKQVNLLFETARANTPAVIFIDEVDAMGGKRSEMHSASIRWSVTQLLTEMDGISSNNHQLLVLGATNAPWDVDAAFRRPGRFDRVLFVPPPDADARAEILQLHARGRKLDANMQWKQVADKAELFSGADLASLVDRACESALSDALRSGNMRDVNQKDFQHALRDMRPSTMEWLRRAKNYVTYANQDGFYSDLADYLAKAKIA